MLLKLNRHTGELMFYLTYKNNVSVRSDARLEGANGIVDSKGYVII